MKPVQGPIAQILQFPSNPESVRELKRNETLLMEELNRVETYDEAIKILRNRKLYDSILSVQDSDSLDY